MKINRSRPQFGYYPQANPPIGHDTMDIEECASKRRRPPKVPRASFLRTTSRCRWDECVNMFADLEATVLGSNYSQAADEFLQRATILLGLRILPTHRRAKEGKGNRPYFQRCMVYLFKGRGIPPMAEFIDSLHKSFY